MKIGFIGLGKMGFRLAKQLLDSGIEVVAWDIDATQIENFRNLGGFTANEIEGLVDLLDDQKIIWLMIPAGGPTHEIISFLADKLACGDIVIDGGNSYYRDSLKHAEELAQRSIDFLDVGTSGGIWGLKEGYCLMVGGNVQAYQRIEPILKTLAPSPDTGYGHVGPSSSGHFVKMVHNGIEYGLMEAYAEGFERVTGTCFKPVVIMGGSQRGSEAEILAEVRAAMDAGAAGATIGRNIFGAKDPEAMTAALSAIIHQDATVEEAQAILHRA